jgi:uncharacterized protein
MFLDLREIREEGVEFDHALDLAQLRTEAGAPLLSGRARLAGQARPGKRGLELRARVEARVRLDCSRCLEPFEREIREEFLLNIVAEAVEYGGPGDTELDEGDATLFYASEGRADLCAIAAEQILLSLPLKPVCRPSCAGLCPTCGVDRNRIECGCPRDSGDPRLAPLAEIKRRWRGP